VAVEVEVFSRFDQSLKSAVQHIDYIEIYTWPAGHDHGMPGARMQTAAMAALGYRYPEQLFSGSVGGDDEVLAEGVVDRAEKAQWRLFRAAAIAGPAAGGSDAQQAQLDEVAALHVSPRRWS